jgi:disulfide bond formation protein DsbB
MLEQLSQLRRPLNLAGFAVCALLIAAAYYLQFVEGMEPCPLCIFQRVAMFALGAAFLLAALHHPRAWGRYIYGLLIALSAGIGAAIAGRHVWLQSLPADQVPSCGPGLNYILDTFAFVEAIAVVLRGSGECAEVDMLLGLSLPLWTLIAFIGLGIAGVAINFLGAGRGRPLSALRPAER